jgi:hypothetical protein
VAVGGRRAGTGSSILHRASAMIMRPVMRLWHVKLIDSWSGVPRAADSTSISIDGPDPHGVLLVGSSLVAGFGVVTHNLGLVGCLGRQLSKVTGRGVAVSSRASIGATVRQMVPQVQELVPARVDAAMVMLAADDAIRLTPIAAWREDLGELIDVIKDASGDNEVPIVVVGVPSLELWGEISSIPRQLSSLHRRSLNENARQLCDEHRTVRFVEFPSLNSDSVDLYNGASDSYRFWSRRLSVPLAEALGHQPQMDAPTRASLRPSSTVTCPKCGERAEIVRNPFYGTGLAVHEKFIDCRSCRDITLITKSELPAFEREADGASHDVFVRSPEVIRT